MPCRRRSSPSSTSAREIFGPPTGKDDRFLDDLNMPYVETYGTVPLTARPAHVYSTFYDREDLGFKKEVVDTQYVAMTDGGVVYHLRACAAQLLNLRDPDPRRVRSKADLQVDPRRPPAVVH